MDRDKEFKQQIKQIPDGRVQVVVEELYRRIRELETPTLQKYDSFANTTIFELNR